MAHLLPVIAIGAGDNVTVVVAHDLSNLTFGPIRAHRLVAFEQLPHNLGGGDDDGRNLAHLEMQQRAVRFGQIYQRVVIRN